MIALGATVFGKKNEVNNLFANMFANNPILRQVRGTNGRLFVNIYKYFNAL
jgi:hypothetical protein